jgi:nicotinate dehydrogenase subunit A
MTVTVTINGRQRELNSDPATPLLYVLRGELALNGAKYGCGLGQCGACTVQVDGKAVFSCLLPLGALAGRQVRTVEGLGTIEHPGALQKAFAEEQAAQCGYCIAGMIMRAQELLDGIEKPGGTIPDDAAVRRHMQPNLCRCGTSMRILRSIHRAVVEAAAGGRESKS